MPLLPCDSLNNHETHTESANPPRTCSREILLFSSVMQTGCGYTQTMSTRRADPRIHGAAASPFFYQYCKSFRTRGRRQKIASAGRCRNAAFVGRIHRGKKKWLLRRFREKCGMKKKIALVAKRTHSLADGHRRGSERRAAAPDALFSFR